MPHVTVAHLAFMSQAALLAYVRKLLERTGECHSLQAEHPDAYPFLQALLQRHPRPEKLSGLHDLMVRRNALNRQAWELCVVRQENASQAVAPFSWRSCVSRKPRVATQARLQVAPMHSSTPMLMLEVQVTACALGARGGHPEVRYGVPHIAPACVNAVYARQEMHDRLPKRDDRGKVVRHRTPCGSGCPTREVRGDEGDPAPQAHHAFSPLRPTGTIGGPCGFAVHHPASTYVMRQGAHGNNNCDERARCALPSCCMEACPCTRAVPDA
jgi:hypothetical protein